MADQFPPVKINFASVQVVGWPGLSLVLIAAAIAVEFPEIRWLLLAALAAGCTLGAAVILVRRRRLLHAPPGHPHHIDDPPARAA